MDWEKIFRDITAYIAKYVDVKQLSEDVQTMLVERFEQLIEEGTVPEAIVALWAEFKDDYALSLDEIKAVIADYILKSNRDVVE